MALKDNLNYEESYVIATTMVPKDTYSLGNGYTLRPIRFSETQRANILVTLYPLSVHRRS